MGDREGFRQRVEELGINPDALEEVRLKGDMPGIIPNKDGKINSLQIYAAITTNDSRIGPEEAKAGLDVFGKDLRNEARENPGKHPSIDRLERIVENGEDITSLVVRRESAKQIPPEAVENIMKIAESHPTPFHYYHAPAIRQTMQRLNNAFSWVPEVNGKGFQNFFAVKACPNPHILTLVETEGFGADCSSKPELSMSSWAGIDGENIMFTSNDTPDDEFERAKQLGAIINLDDIEHIPILEQVAGIPDIICFRYNPGVERTGNAIIGQPTEAKYGLTKEQLFEAYKIMRDKGVKRFGLHTMVASNELNSSYFVETARMLFDLVKSISKQHGIRFEFVNMGGGIGTPYKPEQREVNLEWVGEEVRKLYDDKIKGNGLDPLRVVMECGRLITGPHGYLASKVRHVTQKHKGYVGLDACMANLMRPALYGAYHHITVLGKEGEPKDCVYDVTGSLCENNDKFAINRPLPKLERGDLVVIHNTGAHGWAMGFQYNGKLRSAEFLGDEKRSLMIRRQETEEDYFRTIENFHHGL